MRNLFSISKPINQINQLRYLAALRSPAGGYGSRKRVGGSFRESTTIDAIPVGSSFTGSFLSSASDSILGQSALVIGRQLEMLNIFLGYEQANKYVIYHPRTAQPLGYILEEAQSLSSMLLRQIARTHRPFNATVIDCSGQIIMKLRRPFQFINSRLFVSNEYDEPIGEVQQRWHLLRRRYDLILGKTQFAEIDAPWLSWDFHMNDENYGLLATVNKNFTGFAREIFTDTSQYVLRMGQESDEYINPFHGPNMSLPWSRDLTVDEKAIALACAVSIDFDYFSRHSGQGGIPIPFFFPFFGGGEELADGNASTEEGWFDDIDDD